ncbi:hypothetical protein LCGC14_2731320 [marine sediment metagenome]|uniref:Uncharacterized protein n=1 Tax=marine sediment metagenome TaxID=412755 RepID=A0A0F9BG32_9ZZZZ
MVKKIVKIKGRIKRNGRWLYIDNYGLVCATSKFGYLIAEQIQPEPNLEYSRSKMWVSFKVCTEVD